jgi:hypothetical protein
MALHIPIELVAGSFIDRDTGQIKLRFNFELYIQLAKHHYVVFIKSTRFFLLRLSNGLTGSRPQQQGEFRSTADYGDGRACGTSYEFAILVGDCHL